MCGVQPGTQNCGSLVTSFVGDPEISPQETAKGTLAQCFQNNQQITEVARLPRPDDARAPITITLALLVAPESGQPPCLQAALLQSPLYTSALQIFRKCASTSSCQFQKIPRCFKPSLASPKPSGQSPNSFRWTLQGLYPAIPLHSSAQAKSGLFAKTHHAPSCVGLTCPSGWIPLP